jgi:hypothetical protein
MVLALGMDESQFVNEVEEARTRGVIGGWFTLKKVVPETIL